MNRRQWRVLLAVGIVLGALAGVAVAAHLTNTTPTSGEVPLGANSGATIVLEGNAEADLTDFTDGTDTVDLRTESGNITATSNGPASFHVHKDDITGTWTNTTQVDASSNDITINPEDKQPVTVGGDVDHIAFRQMGVDNGAVDFSYGGPSGQTTVTLTGLPANTYIAALDSDSGKYLDGGQTASDGTLTLTLPNSDHDVKLQSSDGAPELSNPSPVGEINSRSTTVSIDVDDPDFPETNVTVEIEVNGTVVHTETLTSAGTVETDVTVNGSDHTVTATATDDFNQTTAEEWSFQTPNEIELRKENTPSELVDNTTVDLAFYTKNGDEVFTRNTSDGTVDLEGLPADETLIISTEADGYADRQLIIDSLAEQTTLYLLNTSDTTVHSIRFTLTDRTGQYPEDNTELYIDKPITVNGTTTYQTVAADTFGVEGYETILESGQRYRLSVRNDRGDTRVVNRYTPTQNETVEVEVGKLDFGYDGESNTYEWSAGVEQVTVTENGEEVERDHVTWTYSDPYGQTTELNVKIYERDNASNVLYQDSFSDLGNVSFSEVVTENQTGNAWVVEIDGTRAGENVTGRTVIGGQVLDPGVPLDPFWRQVISVLGLFVLGGVFGGIRAELGAIIISMSAGVLWYMDWLADVTAGMILVALFIAVLYRVRSTAPAGV